MINLSCFNLILQNGLNFPIYLCSVDITICIVLISKYKSRNYLEVKELIALCIRRDRQGEKLLYERYVAVMARLCQRYVKDRAEVQDVLIEGFVKVFEKLKTFEYRGEHSLEVWIRRIMINECLMRLRKRQMYLSALDDENDSVQPANDGSETREIIMLMHHLPAGYRMVINLYVIDGYSHKEIAELLGITESASRSQLTHARNKLKDILNKHGWNGMIN
jgi:RNA polymerase sigma-70 factor, ECF subfamily